MPKRIQMSRQRPWRHEHPDAVIVARPSKWGNPFRAVREGGFQWVEDPKGRRWSNLVCSTDREATRLEMVRRSIDLFALHIGPMGNYEPDDIDAWLAPLQGRDLACWCPLSQPCHADVLLELANGGA